MSRFNTGAAAMAEAKALAASGGKRGGDFGWLKLADGESAVVRFVTGMDNMFVYNHACGIKNWEIGEKGRTELINSGQFNCPSCKQPFTDADLVGQRSGIVGVPQHEFVPSPTDGKQKSYVCLDGYVDEAGKSYPCPICKMRTWSSKYNKEVAAYPARQSVYGAAVRREPQFEVQTVNGVPMNRIVSVEDCYVERKDDEGKVSKHLDMLMVKQSFGNFWSVLASIHEQLQQQAGGGISWYDFTITRTGEKLDTKYSVEKVTSDPNPLPFEQYSAVTPDILNFVDNMGSPEYYAKNGFAVEGFVYVPKADAPAQAAPVAQAVAPVAAAPAPVAPVAAPVAPVAPAPVAAAPVAPPAPVAPEAPAYVAPTSQETVAPVDPAPVAPAATVFEKMNHDLSKYS